MNAGYVSIDRRKLLTRGSAMAAALSLARVPARAADIDVVVVGAGAAGIAAAQALKAAG